MPITTNLKIIQKYVPHRHLAGSCVEVDNSGYTLIRDNFFSIFPSIMEYNDKDPFGVQETTLRYRWSAYVIIEGNEYLGISKGDSFESLITELSNNNIEIFAKIPKAYVDRIEENESKVMGNVWKTYMQKNIVMYIKCQTEYGYMQGENYGEKAFMFKKDYNTTFMQKLNQILRNKILLGEITQNDLKNILAEYERTTSKK